MSLKLMLPRITVLRDRDIRDKAKYAPTQADYKVYIIDEVHMLSTGAFNALLKTLEEPPTNVIFILATTSPIKSRQPSFRGHRSLILSGLSPRISCLEWNIFWTKKKLRMMIRPSS